MGELSVGDPTRLATDVGPLITAEARDDIAGHVATMRARGHAVEARGVAGGVPRTGRSCRRPSSKSRKSPTSSAKCSGRCCMCCGSSARSAMRSSRRSTPPATPSRSACTRASTRRSAAFWRRRRRATPMSTATSSAPWSACSRSAAPGCPGRGRRRAGRCICAGCSKTRRAWPWAAGRQRRSRLFLAWRRGGGEALAERRRALIVGRGDRVARTGRRDERLFAAREGQGDGAGAKRGRAPQAIRGDSGDRQHDGG